MFEKDMSIIVHQPRRSGVSVVNQQGHWSSLGLAFISMGSLSKNRQLT
jgi:hypothetical protein